MRKKEGIGQISRTDFIQQITGRLKAISAAPDAPVSDLYSHAPNKLAAALHPHAQHLVVKEIVEHSPDMKSFLLSPDPARGTKSLAWFSAGQYIVVALNVDGKTVSRPYSLRK